MQKYDFFYSAYIYGANTLQNSGGKVVFLGGFHGTPLGHQREYKYLHDLGHLSVKECHSTFQNNDLAKVRPSE